ncbi:MAG: hypothetical protein WD208_03480 [Dehalococcoidia bacterium]
MPDERTGRAAFGLFRRFMSPADVAAKLKLSRTAADRYRRALSLIDQGADNEKIAKATGWTTRTAAALRHWANSTASGLDGNQQPSAASAAGDRNQEKHLDNLLSLAKGIEQSKLVPSPGALSGIESSRWPDDWSGHLHEEPRLQFEADDLFPFLMSHMAGRGAPERLAELKQGLIGYRDTVVRLAAAAERVLQSDKPAVLEASLLRAPGLRLALVDLGVDLAVDPQTKSPSTAFRQEPDGWVEIQIAAWSLRATTVEEVEALLAMFPRFLEKVAGARECRDAIRARQRVETGSQALLSLFRPMDRVRKNVTSGRCEFCLG